MSDIPFSFCREILLRLPAMSLFRLRAVCKRWRAIIDDPGFVKAHIDNQLSSNTSNIIIRNSTGPPFYPFYYFDLEALDFINGPQTIAVTPLNFTPSGLSRLPALPVAACNGLMLIAPVSTKEYDVHRNINCDNEINWDPKGTWEIMNPLTHERLKLPQPNINSHHDVVGLGLGYDCAADDYKVVVIDYEYDDVNDKNLSLTHVYSLKLDSWRNIGNCPFILWSRKIQYGGLVKIPKIQHGVFLKGALHWVSDDGIIVFDVGTENYLQLQLALPPLIRKPESMQLDALSGCLLLSYGGKHFHVWVMKNHGGNISWMELFELERSDLRPVAYMKNKNRVLLKHQTGLIWFDVGSNSLKTVSIHGICRSSKNYFAQTCVGSLFRLHDSCGRVAASSKRNAREMKMVDTKLTFCVKDYVKHDPAKDPPHDKCYSASNWYNSSCESNKVRASSFNPDVDSTTLPLDICREILLYLPAKSLIRFRAVCNAWQAVIDEPCFVRAHTNKQHSSNTSNIIIRNSTGPPFHPLYSFDLDDLKFTNGLQKITVAPLDISHDGLSLLRTFPVSACNGLILVANNKSWEIWNPLSHERLELPQLGFNSNLGRVAIGLGYDYTSDDYKVVVIHCHCDPYDRKDVRCQTYLYSLRLDLWRNVGSCPHDDDWRSWGPDCPGVFLCGALHWPSFNLAHGGRDTIIVFDLGTESYRQLQAPPLQEKRNLNVLNRYLGVLDGCLVVSDFAKANFLGDELEHFDVWLMKDYGAGDSWIKLLCLEDKECGFYSFGYHSRPVAYAKDKTHILLQDDRCGGIFFGLDYRCGFFLFDAKSNSRKRVDIHGLTGSLQAQNIPRSIFRLHDNCGVDDGRRRRRRMERESNTKMSDTMLNFCVRDAKRSHCYHSHDSCYSLDPNWDYSSSEIED